MTLLTSLPDRPLTLDEGETLADSDTVAPLTVLTADADDHRQGVYTLFVTSGGRASVLGYHPDEGGWTVIDAWTEDEWNPTKQDRAVSAFLDAHYDGIEQEHMADERGA